MEDLRVRELISSRRKIGLAFATVHVGPEKKTYIIHREVLARTSEFFANALNGNFQEKDGVIHLPETEPEAFDVYQQWIYSGLVYSENEEKILPSGSVDRSQEFVLLFHCVVLSDRLQDRRFHNSAIDAIIQIMVVDEVYPDNLAAGIWVRLPPTAPLRKLIVDIWVHCGHEPWYDTCDDAKLEYAQVGFWIEVARGLSKKMNSPSKHGRDSIDPWVKNKHRYHIHRDGDLCL